MGAVVEKDIFLAFSAPITPQTAQTLMLNIAQQIQQGFTTLHLLFSTPGGQVDAGITLHNTLRALPVRLIMHNTGNIDSIGNAVFLAAEERYASPNSRFMFHGVGFEV